MNMKDASGIEADISQLTINLADYEFNADQDFSGTSGWDPTITHDDIQSALLQQAKLSGQGLLDRCSGRLANYEVTLTVDKQEYSRNLQSTLEALDIEADGTLSGQERPMIYRMP